MEKKLSPWEQEYYPITAKELASKHKKNISLLRHSLKKWTGLLPFATEEHRIKQEDINISNDYFSLEIAAKSCALCELYYKEWGECRSCPLYKMLGFCCAIGYRAPFEIWRTTGDALPMVEALLKLLNIEERKNHERLTRLPELVK